MNLADQSYINQLYENHLRFFNISSYLKTIQEVIQTLMMQSPLFPEKAEEIYNRFTLLVLVTKMLNSKQKTVLLMNAMMK